jgi:N utilization substance protein B
LKSRTDLRHQRRFQAVQKLFEWWFFHDNPEKKEEIVKRIKEEKQPLVLETIANIEEIDRRISQAAREWPIEGIAKADLSILRLAVYELFYGHTAPVKVIIDEAVELAKELGGETSPSFINGVLGKIVDLYGLNQT